MDDTPLRFLCVQHHCPSRQHCYRYRADRADLPVMVCQFPACLTRCRNYRAIPPDGKTRKVQ